jgi:hypothetical protein
MFDKLMQLMGSKGPTGRIISSITAPETPQPNYTNVAGELGQKFNDINALEKSQTKPPARSTIMLKTVSPQRIENLKSSTPNIARGDFDRAGRAKGGKVSYKSISDMERGR